MPPDQPQHSNGSALDPDPFEGTSYRALCRLGSGSRGEVFLVEHRAIARRFAAKALRAELAGDARLVDRWRLEAQALGRLSHPHIVSIVNLGSTADGRPFLVTEYLRGRTLAEELRVRGRLPVTEAVAHGVALLSALRAAHALGVVHRDVCLTNVFLADCGEGDGGRVLKVLDFGIARVLPGAPAGAPRPLEVPTTTGMLLGTPRFTCPEAAMGAPVDERGDVYGTGLVLYALLAGRGPFDHVQGARKLLTAHRYETPRPPSDFATEPIPAELDGLVLRALAKDPNARFQTADEFERRLQQIAALLAQPVGWLATTSYDRSRLHEDRAASASARRPRGLSRGALGLVFLLVVSVFLFATAGVVLTLIR